MVGLLKKSHKSSIESKLKNKMSDSHGKKDVDDKKESSLSNGSEKPEEAKEAALAQPADEEKMEVDEEKSGDKSETEENEVASNLGSRKGRTSRSESSNSVASGQIDKNNSIMENKHDGSEDEDFIGFESPKDSNIEDTLLQLKQCIGEDKDASILNNEIDSTEVANSDRVESDDDQSTEKASVSDVMESGFDNSNMDSASVDNDSNYGATPSSARKGVRSTKKSISVDLSNPELRKPFEYGWVRELVYRSTTDSSVRRNADIYYYTPNGKKVRSSREIIEHLSGELTVDNFSFFKEPIGLDDPAKEIIREAKAKPGPRGYEDGTPAKKVATPKSKISTATSSSSPKISPKETPKTNNTTFPKVVFKGSVTPKSKPIPSSSKSKLDKKRKSAGPDDVDILMDSPEWNSEQKNDPARDVCSIECRLAMGIIPTLQCIICLCLYHPECCGFQPDKMKRNQFDKYICKNCQATKISQAAGPSHPLPPPLAPLPQRPTKVVVTTTQSNLLTNTPSVSTSSSTNSRPGGIVGAVTTWLAPSSSIQVSSKEASAQSPADVPIQGLVTVAGKKYVLVPRQDVVNINTQQPSTEGEVVSNPTGLFLVPCFPHQQLANGPATIPKSSSVPLTNGLKRPCESPVPDSSSPPEKRPKRERDDKDKEDRLHIKASLSKASADNFMSNLNAGFVSLIHAFQYLKVHELLRASCVSKVWNFIATHNLLWETVRMKNSRVSDWKGFAQMLTKRGTRSLDLRKMLIPEKPEEQAKMWKDLCEAVRDIKSIVKVDMGRCSPAAFVAMAEAAPQLESLVSLAIKGNEIDLLPIATNCKNLTELKLKAVSGGLEVKDLSCLKQLTNLQHLALTTIKNLQGIENYLPEGLISLELGECSQLTLEFATKTIPRLVNLKRLRLEKGQNECPTLGLLDAISKLPLLTQLELINFDIKPGFEKTICKCSNLLTLLIIPTYVTQSATTNHVVMGGVAKLSATLKYFIWGLTLELLKVTDLFIGQVENQKSGKAGPPPQKKGSGDSIPILKPCGDGELKEGSQAPSQVDILALPNLQRVLSTLLPTTKIKILKVPFSATWRQTVSDAP